MNLDPSLAHTAIIELYPSMTEAEAAPLRRDLAQAMTEANPGDRWAFAKSWLAERRLAEQDKAGAPYTVPGYGGVTYAEALAIARSAHPSRVLANTRVYRYGRFTATPWCAVCGSAELAPSHTEGKPNHTWTPAVDVTLMGNRIATFHARGVTLYSCGYTTTTTSEALSNLVTGGYFYHDASKLYWSCFATSGGVSHTAPATEGDFYPYLRKVAI